MSEQVRNLNGANNPMWSLADTSQFLSQNPYAVRNCAGIGNRLNNEMLDGDQSPNAVICSYIDSMRGNRPKYFETVKNYVDLITPLTGRERGVVLLSFAAYQNQVLDTLNNTLEYLVFQDGFEEGEINILCFGNKPPWLPYDASTEIVWDYMDVGVQAFWGDVEARRNKSRPRLGYIKGLLFDVSMYRLQRAVESGYYEDGRLPYFYMADDDIVSMPDFLLAEFGAFLDDNSDIDIVIGPGTWDNRSCPLEKIPDLLLGGDLMLLLGDLNRRIFDRVVGDNREELNEEQRKLILEFMFSLAFTKPILVNIGLRPEALARVGGMDTSTSSF